MNPLYERITGLCKQKGIKGGKMCVDLGMSKATLTELKMGRQNGLSAANALKIATYLGVSVNYLLGEDEPKTNKDISMEVENLESYTLYDRITDLCKERCVSGSRMCLDLGLSKSTMSDMKSGRKKGLNAETAQKIANYFGVSVGYLLGKETQELTKSPSATLTEGEQRLLESFRNVPKKQQQMVLQMFIAALRTIE